MKWLIRCLCVSLLAGASWIVLGIVLFTQSGDITFLKIGAVVFVLVQPIMAIYFIRLYHEHPKVKSSVRRKENES